MEFLRQLFAAGPMPAKGSVHPRHPGWGEFTPSVTLSGGARLRLRPLAINDGPDWCRQRVEDREILEPVEPTVEQGWEKAHSMQAWRAYFINLRQAADVGAVVPLVIEIDGRFAGQLTLGNIQRGIISECWVGYWVSSRYQGMGVATAACALGVDHAFTRVGLHRVTATYLPFNEASRLVLARNGFTEEGFLRRNLHINGRWQDHHTVAMLDDDYEDSCVCRLVAEGRIRRGNQS